MSRRVNSEVFAIGMFLYENQHFLNGLGRVGIEALVCTLVDSWCDAHSQDAVEVASEVLSSIKNAHEK